MSEPRRGICPCACCGELRTLAGRSLCRACYARNRRHGTLDWYPLKPPRVAGVATNPPPGMSYRQLDYWVRRGYLRPGNVGAGSGSTRVWSKDELRVASLMARLVQAGLPPATASMVARSRGARFELAPGVVVRVVAS
jgi:MerR-like DNA binding protein